MTETKFQVEVPVRVEFEDVDVYRIAHHTKLIAYLERARVRFFQKYDFNIIEGKYSIVLHKLDVRFTNPAKFLDDLTVNVSLKSANESRIKLSYRIRRDKQLIAKASSELACIDPASQRIALFPESLLERFRLIL
ncbi:MAG: acyl-CoA thioesterase [Calditrichaceae bacterium]|nr:acyl-CoA thioesterase [Calditrichaceae bacterium]HES59723.1 acyl-CoA thioesterase [Caldithrix sp.]